MAAKQTITRVYTTKRALTKTPISSKPKGNPNKCPICGKYK